VVAQANEITDATGRVIASDYQDGFDELAAAKAKYRDELWFGQIQGEFTEDFLKYPNWVIRVVGPFHDQGTSWGYDPMPTLRQVSAWQLWILAAEDRDGERVYTRYADGYYPMMVEWIRSGTVTGPYGRAAIAQAALTPVRTADPSTG